MAQIKVGAALSGAWGDLTADWKLAGRLYIIALVVRLLLGAPSILLQRAAAAGVAGASGLDVLASLVSYLAGIAMVGWVLAHWARHVAQRAAPGQVKVMSWRIATVGWTKLIAMMFVAGLGFMLLGLASTAMAKLGVAGAALLLVLLLIGVVAVIWWFAQLVLLPFRATLGFGGAVDQCLAAAKGRLGSLLRLGLAALAIELAAALVMTIILGVLIAVGVKLGLIPPPDFSSVETVSGWEARAFASGGFVAALYISEIIAAPVMAVASFVVMGAYLRAVLALQAVVVPVVQEPDNPWQV